MPYTTSVIQITGTTITDAHTADAAEELLSVRVVAEGNTTAQVMDIVFSDGTDRYLGHVVIPDRTVTTSLPPYSTQFVVPNIFLANTEKIRVKSDVAENFTIFVTTRDA